MFFIAFAVSVPHLQAVAIASVVFLGMVAVETSRLMVCLSLVAVVPFAVNMTLLARQLSRDFTSTAFASWYE